jgi:hypothetical protein
MKLFAEYYLNREIDQGNRGPESVYAVIREMNERGIRKGLPPAQGSPASGAGDPTEVMDQTNVDYNKVKAIVVQKATEMGADSETTGNVLKSVFSRGGRILRWLGVGGLVVAALLAISQFTGNKQAERKLDNQYQTMQQKLDAHHQKSLQAVQDDINRGIPAPPTTGVKDTKTTTIPKAPGTYAPGH